MIWMLLGAAVLAAALLYFFHFAHDGKPMDLERMNKGGGPIWQQYLKLKQDGERWLTERQSEEVTITSRDGLKLQAIYVPAEKPRACVILMHGYRSSIMQDFGGMLPFYEEAGCSVLLVDQRGCGKSEGKYITFGIKERLDALDWARYMDGRLEGKTPIVLHGLSLGGATVMMASDLPLPEAVAGAISDCGFTSPYDILAHCGKAWFHIPAFPMVDLLSMVAKLLAGIGYRDCSTLEVLARSDLPLLLIHGGKDNFVPTYMTEQNYAAAKSCRGKLIVEEASHGLSYLTAPERYQKAVLDFLDEVLM